MARCITPFIKDGNTLPCGKCYECKARRVSGWSFRLMQEDMVSCSSIFLTLTYANPPMTKNGFMSLCKRDVQLFMKRLRKLHPKKARIRYYACGEYGTNFERPHYHLILFNADPELIQKAWSIDGVEIGTIYIGETTNASVGYTLKYMSKPGKVPKHSRDDREKEFSLMSKKMGMSYLTKQKIRWHRKDLVNRCYIPIEDGKKIAMPRYYKEKVYSKVQRDLIAKHFENLEKGEYVDKLPKDVDKDMRQKELIRNEKYRKSQKDARIQSKF